MTRVVLFMLFLPIALSGQVKDFKYNFTPSAFTDTIPADMLRLLQERKTRALEQYAGLPRPVRASIQKINEQRFKSVVSLFNNDAFITSGPLSGHLNAMLKSLTAGYKSMDD